MSTNKIHQCVETLCNNGCEAVRTTINDMEKGIEPEQAQELDRQEIETVLNELKAIMAIYDEKK